MLSKISPERIHQDLATLDNPYSSSGSISRFYGRAARSLWTRSFRRTAHRPSPFSRSHHSLPSHAYPSVSPVIRHLGTRKRTFQWYKTSTTSPEWWITIYYWSSWTLSLLACHLSSIGSIELRIHYESHGPPAPQSILSGPDVNPLTTLLEKFAALGGLAVLSKHLLVILSTSAGSSAVF